MFTSRQLHEQKHREARGSGLPGWGGIERIENLAKVLDERFFAFNGTPRSGRLLELGCGAGNLSILLAERGYEVVGVDFSETAVEWARENANRANAVVDFKVADVTDLSCFGEGAFDVVYDGNCVHCIHGDDRRRAFQEVRRVLKREGIFFVSSLCAAEHELVFPSEYNLESRVLTESDVPYRYIPTAAMLTAELTDAGFEILRMSERMGTPFGHVNLHTRAKLQDPASGETPGISLLMTQTGVSNGDGFASTAGL